jgi:hypothetical protein
MFKKIRILILLTVFFLIAASGTLAHLRATDWDAPLRVVVYPISGDGSEVADRHIAALSRASFAPMEAWMAEQAAVHGVALADPLDIGLAPRLAAGPPAPPIGGNPLQVALWSLRLRYWAWRNDPYQGPAPQVRLYVSYFDPAVHERLAHSLGLQKGMIGVINVFADRRKQGSNQVVIMHELLHTLGASDKYVPATNQPIYPIGYAEPERVPRHPQRWAEIMGGRIPVLPTEAEIPGSLTVTRVGAATAAEIRWTR